MNQCVSLEVISGRRVHTDNFTRRAYRSRTVRGGLPVYTLRPLRRVRPVHSDHIRMCSQWTRTVRGGLARVDASDASGRERRTVCPCLLTDLFISTDSPYNSHDPER